MPGRADGDRALGHARQCRDRDVLALEHDVLVDLIGDHDEIPLHGQAGDLGQLGPAEHHAGRIVRGVDQDQPGPAGHRVAQHVQVGPEGRRPQRHRHPGGAGHRDARRIGVVVGLERDHLVAGLQQREHGRRDRLGGAGRHQHLGVRVDLQPVEPLLVGGDGLPQLRDARAGRVLVAAAGQDGVGGGPGDLGRAVGVREALAQVDGVRRHGQRRHLGEDRRAHAGEPPVQQRSSHLRPFSPGRERWPAAHAASA